jgi:carbon-monoxide dehydrogenase medium subunit
MLPTCEATVTGVFAQAAHREEVTMPTKPNAYYRPQNMEDALRLLAQPNTVALAGGTELLATEEGLAEEVVDLQALGLDQIEAGDGELRVGAMTTLAALSHFLAEEQAQHGATPLLQQVIRQAGPNTYRNAATVGGMIAGRLVDSEFLAALLVLGTTVHFAASAASPIALHDYLDVEQPPAGLITALHISWLPGSGVTERVARTPADYPIVSITAWQPDGASPRLAATGIAARPRRLSPAEAVLQDDLDQESIAAAAIAASESAVHPGDFRGDAAYRAEMAAVLTRRALHRLQE